jgi:hypothetical protein
MRSASQRRTYSREGRANSAWWTPRPGRTRVCRCWVRASAAVVGDREQPRRGEPLAAQGERPQRAVGAGYPGLDGSAFDADEVSAAMAALRRVSTRSRSRTNAGTPFRGRSVRSVRRGGWQRGYLTGGPGRWWSGSPLPRERQSINQSFSNLGGSPRPGGAARGLVSAGRGFRRGRHGARAFPGREYALDPLFEELLSFAARVFAVWAQQ